MNKKMMIPLMIVLLLTMVAIPVFAADVDLDFDIDNGFVTVLHTGEDASTWHPGQVGQSNYFTASGDVIGTYDSYEGTFGRLSTYIDAGTDIGGGTFTVSEYMDFNVLSANHIYNTEGYFWAGASGLDAEMNMKFVGSMYVWSEADDSGVNCLMGSSIYKVAEAWQNGGLEGSIGIQVNTDGLAWMDNQYAWGFGIGEHGSVTADYSLGTNHIGSTGTGIYQQTAFGNDYLEFNGIVLNSGGSASISGGFTGGYTGTYTMSGN